MLFSWLHVCVSPNCWCSKLQHCIQFWLITKKIFQGLPRTREKNGLGTRWFMLAQLMSLKLTDELYRNKNMMLLYIFFLVENRNIGSSSMVRSSTKKNNGYDFKTDFSQIRLEKLPSKSASFGEKAATASEVMTNWRLVYDSKNMAAAAHMLQTRRFCQDQKTSPHLKKKRRSKEQT